MLTHRELIDRLEHTRRSVETLYDDLRRLNRELMERINELDRLPKENENE
jgi:hypothetical protein